MKKKITFLFVSILLAALFVVSDVTSFTNGPPSNSTGSLGDNGITCVQCHASNNNARIGWISSNQLSDGYVPGNLYSMKARAIMPGVTKFGFEITIEDMTGDKAGVPVATDAVNTQITNTHYISHTAAGTSGNDSAVWNFGWNSPAAGLGTITFYGAFVGANSNSQNTGDKVFISSLEVIQFGTQGIANTNASGKKFYVYPNPAKDIVTIDLQIPDSEASLNVYNLNGQLVKSVKYQQADRMNFDVHDMANGSYILKLTTDSDIYTARLSVIH